MLTQQGDGVDEVVRSRCKHSLVLICIWMLEPERARVESLPGKHHHVTSQRWVEGKLLGPHNVRDTERFSPVGTVAHERMLDVREVRPDLMCPAESKGFMVYG